MKDNMCELLPIVDSNGNTIGKLTRGEAHSGSKILHPVVHLHVFNKDGMLFLQQRPEWKDIQPGKWDTACGGHVAYGEDIPTALRREVEEELGITDYVPNFINKYVFESSRERELVHIFSTIYEGIVNPSTEELAGGKYWHIDDIIANIGKGVFTPNFESEFQRFLME